MEHSKLPWKIVTEKEGEDFKVVEYQHLTDANDEYVIPYVDASENAINDIKFIVEACNNYEKLQQINKELLKSNKEIIADIEIFLKNWILQNGYDEDLKTFLEDIENRLQVKEG